MTRSVTALPAIRRSNQVYYEQVSDRITLDVGYAYTSAIAPHAPEANFLGEVLLDPDVAEPLAMVETHFADEERICHRWIPSREQDVAALEQLLSGRDFRRRELLTFALPAATVFEAEQPIKLVSARALRRGYRRLTEARAAEFAPPALVESLTTLQLERLNDAQYDAFVATVADQPQGMISVFQVGEIGRICDAWLAPEVRRAGHGRALLRAAVNIARRWNLNPICAQVASDNAAGIAWLEDSEFVPGDPLVMFCRPDFVEVGG